MLRKKLAFKFGYFTYNSYIDYVWSDISRLGNNYFNEISKDFFINNVQLIKDFLKILRKINKNIFQQTYGFYRNSFESEYRLDIPKIAKQNKLSTTTIYYKKIKIAEMLGSFLKIAEKFPEMIDFLVAEAQAQKKIKEYKQYDYNNLHWLLRVIEDPENFHKALPVLTKNEEVLVRSILGLPKNLIWNKKTYLKKKILLTEIKDIENKINLSSLFKIDGNAYQKISEFLLESEDRKKLTMERALKKNAITQTKLKMDRKLVNPKK